MYSGWRLRSCGFGLLDSWAICSKIASFPTCVYTVCKVLPPHFLSWFLYAVNPFFRVKKHLPHLSYKHSLSLSPTVLSLVRLGTWSWCSGMCRTSASLSPDKALEVQPGKHKVVALSYTDTVDCSSLIPSLTNQPLISFPCRPNTCTSQTRTDLTSFPRYPSLIPRLFQSHSQAIPL